MKKCSKCKLEKDFSEFSISSTKADKLQARCKECNKKNLKAHYNSNKQIYKQKLKEQRLLLRQFAYDHLKAHACIDCGEEDPVVLEFDHINDKIDSISALTRVPCSLQTLKVEIAKCEIRCSNCHKRKTAKQFNWYKDLKL